MRTAVICAAMALIPVAGHSQTMANCTKTETGQARAAMHRAEGLLLTATAAIGPNEAFDRWFGPYHPKTGDVVRRNLKSMVKALRSDKVTAECKNNGQGLCASDTYAFINRDTPLHVNLCPNFFAMDTMKQLNAASLEEGTGTRAGTIIHEVSHFHQVAGTEDVCYTREECSDMARSAPQDALINADNYQYFVEDVTFLGVGGQTGAGND